MAKVLVADDNRDVADSVGELLSLFGHDVRVAYDGEQALSEIECSPPQAVLLDLGMPCVDGFQIAKRVRERYGRAIRLIAHTAFQRAAVARKAAEAGFNCFVQKPAQPYELALAIQGSAGAPELRSGKRDRRAAQRSTGGRRRRTPL